MAGGVDSRFWPLSTPRNTRSNSLTTSDADEHLFN